jgi:hypothetical protein
MITQSRLKELIVYDPATGELRWLAQRGNRRAGAVAGHVGSGGYLRVKIDGEMHLGHRLVWLYMTGEWPAGELDHEDRVGSNNKWANIREATRSQNGSNRGAHTNNKLGIKGVFRVKGNRPSPYLAKIRVGGAAKCIGYFRSPEEAGAAYQVAAKKYYGEFASNG